MGVQMERMEAMGEAEDAAREAVGRLDFCLSRAATRADKADIPDALEDLYDALTDAGYELPVLTQAAA